MFLGNNPAKVDEKGRLKLPSAFKLQVDARAIAFFYITSADGKSAEIWPLPEWEKIQARLAHYSMDEAVQKFMNLTSYYGQLVQIDAQGRLLLPQILRVKADLNSDVDAVVIGKTTYLEVKNRAAFERDIEANQLTVEDRRRLATILQPRDEKSGEGD
jgi:MraZ protein